MDQYIEFATNHYLLVFCWFCAVFLLVQDLISNSFNKFDSVSPLVAVGKINASHSLVIDVREPQEFNKSHIEDALNIPLDKLESKLTSLDEYKKYPLIVVCQAGHRSASACKTLIKAGFEQVYNIAGGMQSWEDNKLPIRKK